MRCLHRIGKDVSEHLDVVPAQVRVIVIRRLRYACRACEDVVQAPAPARLAEPSGPGSPRARACATCGWSLWRHRSGERGRRRARASGRCRRARRAWCGRWDGSRASARPPGGGVVCSLEAPGKRQACSSVAQRASSQQCSATKQPNWAAWTRTGNGAATSSYRFRVSSGNQPRLIVRARMLLPFALPKPE
jgi:zinc-finger binding domain of transposase IS66